MSAGTTASTTTSRTSDWSIAPEAAHATTQAAETTTKDDHPLAGVAAPHQGTGSHDAPDQTRRDREHDAGRRRADPHAREREDQGGHGPDAGAHEEHATSRHAVGDDLDRRHGLPARPCRIVSTPHHHTVPGTQRRKVRPVRRS